MFIAMFFFFSSRRRHTRYISVTGVQTCALPIYLYYRLSTVPIRVPALHDRQEDIILLFRKFTADFAEKYKTVPVQLDDEAKNLLINYPWPGNVRELKNIAEQVSVLSAERMVTAKELRRFL